MRAARATRSCRTILQRLNTTLRHAVRPGGHPRPRRGARRRRGRHPGRSSHRMLRSPHHHVAAGDGEQADLLVQMADEAELLIARLESMKGVEPAPRRHRPARERGRRHLPAHPRPPVRRRVRGPRGPPLEGHRGGDGGRPQHVRGHLGRGRVDRPEARLTPTPSMDFARPRRRRRRARFDFVNGFHDAANSIATVVSTRVLSPRAAVVWAAFFNFAAFLVFGDPCGGHHRQGRRRPRTCCRSASSSPGSSAPSSGTSSRSGSGCRPARRTR